MSDKVFVAWVALALALMLPAASRQSLPLANGVQETGACAVLQLQPLEEGELPSSPSEEPAGQQLPNLIEDDELVHEECSFVLLELSFTLMPVVQLEPDSLHARELERPPLRTA